VKSAVANTDQYLAELSPDRAEILGAVRETILGNLPHGFVEVMDFGMPAYVVPLERYPDTYSGHPLMLAGLAAQKRHLAVYLMSLEGPDLEEFRRRYTDSPPGRAGKRLDLGRSCLRFTRLEDVPLRLVAETIARYDVNAWIERYEASRA
jgi:hypothetical protein